MTPLPPYIALEGAEGSGKSTQAALLAKSLGAVLTQETGGTAIGKRLRQILHDNEVIELDTRAEALIEEAHALGLRVLLDIVPNHTSNEHPWFGEAMAAGPGSHARERYLFRAGRGDGSEPPNDWESLFGGSAWTRRGTG